MYEFLKAHGMSVRNVKLTNLAPPDMVTALVTGSIDGYFAWEPHISYAQERLKEKAIIFLPDGLYHGRHCIAMNKNYVQSHPEIVEKLIRGFLRAEEFTETNPEEAKRIVAKITGLELSVVESLWHEYHVRVELDKKFVGILEKEAQWALTIDPKAKGTIDDVVNSIDTSALKAVRPERVELAK